MPMYDFYCSRCEQKFEELVSRDQQDVPCPKCHGTDTRRLMSRFSSISGAAAGAGTSFLPRSSGGCNPGG